MSLDPLVEEADAGSEVFPYSTNQSDHIFPTLVIASSEFLNEVGGGTLDLGAGFGDGNIRGIQFTGLEVGRIITFVGVNIFSGFAGNMKVGVYDDVAGIPTNLLAESASTALVSNGFNDVALISSAIVPANGIVWLVEELSNNTVHPAGEGGLGGTVIKAHVYGTAFPNPLAGTINTSNRIHFRIGTGGNHQATLAKDNLIATYWQSLNQINQSLRGEFSALADQEPAQITIYVDKSKITNTQFLIQTSPDGIIWTLKRTVNISQLADLQYNFIRFNRDILPIRYIRVIGNDLTAKTFSISEFKALIPDSVQWADRQAHKTISTTGIVGLSG